MVYSVLNKMRGRLCTVKERNGKEAVVISFMVDSTNQTFDWINWEHYGKSHLG